MIQFARLAPPYSIVFIHDIVGGVQPEWKRGSHIEATDSCVALATYCEIDGETDFQLGLRSEVDPGSQPTYQGRLKTPFRMIVIRSVPIDMTSNNVIIEMPVTQTETMVYIWTNHPTVPDQVIVGVE